jgi:two-component system NtrC family sensor kinase
MDNPTTHKIHKGRSVSRALSFFVVVNFLGMGVLIAILLSLRIGQTVDESQRTHVASQIQTFADNIGDYLRDRQQVLSDHAQFPVLLQTLMQPSVNQGVIADFMADLTFLGKRHQEVLLDFRGQTVHASQPLPQFDYSEAPWLDALMKGEQHHYLGISKSKDIYYWRLAKPIIYNGITEGVVVAEIPVTGLTQRLEQAGHLGGLFIEMTWLGESIEQIGTPIVGRLVEVDGAAPGIGLRFYIDHDEATEARNRLMRDVALLIMGMLFIMVLLTIQIGKRWFVRPIERLQQLALSLSNDESYTAVPIDQPVRELALLADSLNHMAERIRRREDALRQKRDELTDLNENLKASQAQLVQSEKMASLGTMAAGVAHEINNPTGFVKNNVAILREYMAVFLPLLEDYHKLAQEQAESDPALIKRIQARLGDENLDYLLEDVGPLMDDTVEGVERISKIVAGLKSFARVDESEDQVIDLNECIETTLRVVWNELKYKCNVQKQLGDLPPIIGNPGQMNQVVMNLLVNAAQAIPKQGDITIETAHQGHEVLLRISDTGEGIAPDVLDKIFTPFFTSKEVGKGTGLGLSISHGIVEKHGGSIEVESEVGKGTLFTVHWPVNGRGDDTSAQNEIQGEAG